MTSLSPSTRTVGDHSAVLALIALALAVGALGTRLHLPLWASETGQAVLLGLALLLLWRNRGTRRPLLVWSVTAIVLVSAFAWFQARP